MEILKRGRSARHEILVEDSKVNLLLAANETTTDKQTQT
jgi:hypothetical protein